MIRLFFFLALTLGHLSVHAAEPVKATAPVQMKVYKSPTCGCCAKWIRYLEQRGFEVSVVDLDNVQPVKRQLGVSAQLQSCHTGVVDGYVIEGHVPAKDIRRLLEERPSVIGLTAPGMPTYSPGMMSIEPRGYDVLSFTRDGTLEIFSSY
jgi:hypothetical protein